jgi:diamine N-acetyltransferase
MDGYYGPGVYKRWCFPAIMHIIFILFRNFAEIFSMLLESKNIKLRAPEPEDLAFFYKWENDTSLWSAGNTLSPYSRYDLKQYIASSSKDVYEMKQLRLMIDLKDDKRTIGIVDLYDFEPHHRRAGTGIFIEEGFRNRGFASEALSLLCDYSFGFLKIHQLYTHISVSNNKSVRLFERCGFRLRGELKDWLITEKGYEDVLVFSLIAGISDN